MPFVYFIHEEGNDPKVFKIGKTSLHPADRCEQLQTGNPRKLVIYRWIETSGTDTGLTPCKQCDSGRCSHSIIEELLHKEHAEHHIRGEWFHINRDVVDISCAVILSVHSATKVSTDYPQWSDEDLIRVQEERAAEGKYRGGTSPRTARKKKKDFWAKKYSGFSDD